MDFGLSDRQVEIVSRGTSMVSRLDLSDIQERDNNFKFSKKSFSLLADLGLNSWLDGRNSHSPAFSATDLVVALEALGEHCSDTGLVFSVAAHLCACVHPIAHFGSTKQIDYWMDKIQKGCLLGAHAITEENSGSDVFSMQTKAEKVDGDYLINGKKTYITNAPFSDFIVLHARTANNGNIFDFSTFVFDSSIPGIKISDIPHEKMGLRTTAMGDIVFDNVMIPSDALIGSEGNGGPLFSISMEWERTCLFALYVGVMKRQLKMTMARSEKRNQFGSPIIANQAVGHQLVDMYMRYEASRLLAYKAAWNIDQGKYDGLSSCVSKITISNAVIENAKVSVELHGALGVIGGEIERHFRNSIPSAIFSGTTNTLKNNALIKLRKQIKKATVGGIA